jgi:haloalkane dehalogenase
MTDTSASAAWRLQYPFESRFIDVGGAKMHYVDQGSHESDVILMMHGNPTWSFYWRHLVSGLSQEYRTIAVDHIGCGMSEKPADHNYCLQQHIDNACELIERLDLKDVTLMAHDWGGAIGMGTLLKMKERFSRIVLFNTAAFPPPYIPFRISVCRWPIVGKIALQGFNLFARAAITMATEQPEGLDPATVDGLLAPYDNWNNRIATYKFVKDIPLSQSHPTWPVLEEIEAGLSSLKDWPIQLIWGMKDWCFRPECLTRLQSHWPNADVTQFEDGGHYIVEDKRNEITPLVRSFLKNNPVSR